MSCSGASGRGVNRASQAPHSTRGATRCWRENSCSSAVLPMPASPCTSVTHPPCSTELVSQLVRSAKHCSRSSNSTQAPGDKAGPVSCRRLRDAAEEPVWTVGGAERGYPQTAPERERPATAALTYRGTAAAARRWEVMSLRHVTLRMSTIGALAGWVALGAVAADQKPADSPCQKLTGADRTECERLVREK